MTLTAFTDLAGNLGIVDNRVVKLADLDTNIRAAVSDSQNTTTVTRSEFMEVMIRTALDKYLKPGLCSTPLEALKKLVSENLKPAMGRFDSDKWRYERYLNEENDLILTSHQDSLQRLFTKYSAKNSRYGEKTWLTQDEFQQCCKDLGLITKSFGPRQVAFCYQLSLFTHKDSLNSKGVNQMSFVEFLEAFARVVDYRDMQEVERGVAEGKWTQEPLDAKLEVVLPEVVKMFRPEGLKRRTRIEVSPPPLS